MSDKQELLTVPEVAKMLRVDVTTVRRWIKNGALPAVTLPHNGDREAYRVRNEDINNLLSAPSADREPAAETVNA